MTQFENLKNMNIDEFTEWLNEYGAFDDSPWMKWFDQKYCKNCPDVMCHYVNSTHEFPCGWCELEHKCKFFTDLNSIPDSKMIIKLWLESKI